MLKYKSDPQDSVEKSGQALEDYLRELANSNGHGVGTKAHSGAGQLATFLVSVGLIHSHHAQLALALGTVRNAKAHKKDKRTLKAWDITPAAAFWALLGVLVTIQSIHEYVYGRKQII